MAARGVAFATGLVWFALPVFALADQQPTTSVLVRSFGLPYLPSSFPCLAYLSIVVARTQPRGIAFIGGRHFYF